MAKQYGVGGAGSGPVFVNAGNSRQDAVGTVFVNEIGATAFNFAGASGSYTITGNAATFLAPIVAVGASGSYTITGNAATFTNGGNTFASGSSGSYAITGNPASFLAPMVGASGSYIITGNAAGFYYSGSPKSGGWSMSLRLGLGLGFVGGSAGGSSIPLYEGAVASRARITHTTDTVNKYMMARSAHIASETLTAIRVVLSNFNTDGGGADVGLGAASDITASVEYPAGTFTRLLFNGVPGGTIPDKSILFADYANVNIPAGATFWVRTFWHNTAGVFCNNWQNTFLGEATALSATAITDQTMSGTIANSGAFSYPPVAILGMTQNVSVVIIGDSLAVSSQQGGDIEDSSNSATGYNAKVGIVARSLGNIPFISLAAGGQTANGWATNSTARSPLITKGSTLICQMGTNDLRGGTTSAQQIANVQAIFALGASFQKKYQTTITPLTTSTDLWATLANQTVDAGNANRIAFNTAVRAGSVSPSGFFDTASVVESSLNSGKWIVTPTPPYTGDGVHPTPSGYLLVPVAGVISGISYP